MSKEPEKIEFEIPYNGESQEISPEQHKSKPKLSKEDLLAGKCQLDDDNIAKKDPRIKSPDELLMGLLANKPQAKDKLIELDKPLRPGERIIDFELEKKIERNTKHKSDHPQRAHKQDEHKIKKNGHLDMKAELSRWQEYQQNVTHWRDRVLEIVTKLKKQVSEVPALKAEILALKGVIEQRNNEIKEFHRQHRKSKKKKH